MSGPIYRRDGVGRGLGFGVWGGIGRCGRCRAWAGLCPVEEGGADGWGHTVSKRERPRRNGSVLGDAGPWA
jgi:hypothetical protein